jgi:asparagine synthetase B (glutamine-hydrolysing)
VPPGHNDGDGLAAALAAEGDACTVLQQLRGPWAAVHWRAATRVLTFGRDVFGATHCKLCGPATSADQAQQDVLGECA